MLYMIECNSKKELPKMAKAHQIQEWVKVCEDDLLHKKCRMIRCYEPATEIPKKLLILLDTTDSDGLDLLMSDFGNDWTMDVFPLNVLHEILKEDHAIVAG